MEEINQEALVSFQLPKYKEIPDVGLYLDQSCKIINQYLQPLPDCNLTNSMISNYVKHKIIANPVKKQYYRDHLAYLLFIAVTKSALSLDNVKRLFDIQTAKYSVEQAYDFFASELQQALKAQFSPKHSGSDKKSYDDIEQQIVHNAIQIVVSKIALDQLFSQIEEPAEITEE